MPTLLIITFLSLSLVALIGYIVWDHYKKSRAALITEQNISLESAYKIIDDAIKKSREILSASELEGGKIVSDTKFYAQKIEKSFEESLNETAFAAQREQANLNVVAAAKFTTFEQAFEQHLKVIEATSK